MEKKKNFIIGVLVVIIIVLLALVFILYKDKNKVSDNSANKPTNSESKVEEVTTLDINSNEVQDLEKIYDLMFDIDSCKFPSPAGEYYTEDSYLFKNIPKYAAISIIFNYENPGEKIFEKTFTETELNRLKEDYKKIFGEENELTFEEEFGRCPTFYYKNGVLSTSDANCGCGGFPPSEAYDYTIRAEKEQDLNEIKIYKKIGFITWESSDASSVMPYISSDVNGKNILNDSYKKYDDAKNNIVNYIENNQDKFNTYIVTYKQNSDNSYYIYSVEKEK